MFRTISTSASEKTTQHTQNNQFSLPVTDFRVDLNVFRGPLDLLLYLVRKHEVEIADIPIAEITEQYLEYLTVLEQLDIGAVGDFLAVASTLIEIKSQQVLPRSDEVEGEVEDPRKELVRRLLEYKKYRDAASMLEERGRRWQERFPRLESDLPAHRRDPAEEPIQEVELWDLISAFGRIMRETEAARPSNIIYDDTPIHAFMVRIHARLQEAGRMRFRDLFQTNMHKSTLIGIFLAILELVRHSRIRVDQNALFGEIWLVPNLDADAPLDLSNVDEYEYAKSEG
ncbi:MAG: segregation/condensation protein A [Pirellulales bacterium]|nr:segregation/condensation protein A [Pirellulales bacterium]